MTKSLVDKLLIKDNVVTDVLLTNGNIVKANKEIILSAGVFGSSAILLRSGIGPKEELNKLEIPVVKNLQVGKDLMDHPYYTVTFKLKKPINDENYDDKLGLFLWCNLENKETNDNSHDLNILIFSMLNNNKISFGIGLVVPKSRGNVKLASNNPHDAPIIDLGLLKDSADIDIIINAVKFVRKLIATSPLNEYILEEEDPGLIKDEDLRKDLIENIDSFCHPSCTNKLMQVVDSDCKVIGIKNLRVVDASIFPHIVSAPINATVIAIAEKISEQIKNKLL